MLMFSIQEENIKIFMNKLLKDTTFDALEVRSFQLETIVKYDISGNINKAYLKDDEVRFFVNWFELKPYIVSLIKGNVKPKYMKIVFSLNDLDLEKIASNSTAMFLNITYNSQNNLITGTTATSQKTFSLDKKDEKVWELELLSLLQKNGINFIIEE